jgi:hypothetical protein
MSDVSTVAVIELDGPATIEPPVSSATAAIGSAALVVTWHLTEPLDRDTTPLLLTVWLPRNGEGPVQLGVEVMPPATAAFAVDFLHRSITYDARVPVRVTGRRIVALFPLSWVDGLDPIEVSHTSVSIADASAGHITLGFTRSSPMMA